MAAAEGAKAPRPPTPRAPPPASDGGGGAASNNSSGAPGTLADEVAVAQAPDANAQTPAVEEPEVAAAARRLGEDARQPAVEHWRAPPGCSLRAYEPPGRNPFWEARSPVKVTCAAADSGSVALNSRRRDCRAGLRNKDMARRERLLWLTGARAAGVQP